MMQQTPENFKQNETRKTSLFIPPPLSRPQKMRSVSLSSGSAKNWSPVISHTRKDDIIFELPPCARPDGKLAETLQDQPESPLFRLSPTLLDRQSTVKGLTRDQLISSANDDKTVEANAAPAKSTSITRTESSHSFTSISLGAIQPEFYKASAKTKKVDYGKICFSMVYDGAVETLTVKIIKVKELQPRISTKETLARNSFVRVFLLPDEKNFHQTKTRNKCNNPIFNEEFSFQVTNSIKSDKTIRFSVYDEMKNSHILLGHALVHLDDVAFNKPNDEMWRSLDKPARPQEIGIAPFGSIHIALSYKCTGAKLGVFIFNVKDLNMLNLEETAGICVKLIFRQDESIKTKKSSTKLNSSCINFNEPFSFNVDKSRIDYMGLTVKVVTYGSSKAGFQRFSSSVKNTMLGKRKDCHVCGQVSFGADNQHGREEADHWREIMARPGKSVPKMHALHDPTHSNCTLDQ